MANAPEFRDDEEREISRGGRGTAIVTWTLAAVAIAVGFSVAMALRHQSPPPARPGTTGGTTTASATEPPSP
jgi:hypothetical protein